MTGAWIETPAGTVIGWESDDNLQRVVLAPIERRLIDDQVAPTLGENSATVALRKTPLAEIVRPQVELKPQSVNFSVDGKLVEISPGNPGRDVLGGGVDGEPVARPG